MWKRLTLIMAITAFLAAGIFLATVTFGQTSLGLVYHQIQIVDETGEAVTDVEYLDIYTVGTTTSQTIYKERGKVSAITLPMEPDAGSTNSTLSSSDGTAYWWGPPNYDYSVTDSNNTAVNADHRARTPSDGRIVFPSYLKTISSSAYLDAQSVTFGTSLDWVFNAGTTDDRLTLTPLTDGTSAMYVGSTSKTADLNLWGATANYDLMWDASLNTLAFRDNAILGFGCGALGGAVDYKISTAGSTGNLVITAVNADDAVEFGDGTIATDVIFHNTSTNTADIRWDDALEIWHWGVDNYGVDVKFWGDSTTKFMIWDESEDELFFEQTDLKLNETAQIEFADSSDTIDWTIDVATANRLLFTCTETDETPNIHIGVASAGADVKIFGTDAGDYFEWDASADLFTIVGDEVVWTIAQASDTSAVDIDITGAVSGFDLDTTNGPVALTAGNATNGDMTLTSVDDFEIDATGKILITSSDNTANAVLITEDGGTSGVIKLHADTGNAATANAASIQLTSDLGAVQLVATANVAATEKASAVQLTALKGAVELYSGLNATNAIKLTADGGANSDIVIYNDQGTSQDSIYLLSDEGATTITSSVGMNDGAILYVTGMVDNGHQLWGGVYADINIGDDTNADTTDGPVYGVAGILWPQNAAAPADIIAGGKFGVNEGANSADLSGATVCGIVIENLLVTGGGDPLYHYMMYFNTSEGAEVPQAWFAATNPSAIAFTQDSNTGATKLGAIKIKIIAGTSTQDHYIWTYDSTGS